MRLLNSIDRWVGRIEGGLLTLFLLSMILLAFAQFVARNLFAAGLVWADAVVRLMVLWIGLIGASLATSQGKHLSIDALTKLIGRRIRPYVDLGLKIFTAFVCLLLLRSAVQFVQIERAAGSSFFGPVPFWGVELVIPISLALISFHLIVGLANALRILWDRWNRR